MPTPIGASRQERSDAFSVTLIGKSNGVGLARDLRLLAEALERCGCRVQVHAAQRADGRRRRSFLVQSLARTGAWLRRGRPTAWPPRRVNLMLEHVWPQFLGNAELNIAVPNPEWFDHRDRRLLSAVDGIWAKTEHTRQVFEALGCRTRFIGFDSDDRYEPLVPRERSFFHLAGKSRMKGTAPLLSLWLRHPEWPTLVVVQHTDRRHADAAGASPQITQAAAAAGNIVWHREYLSDEALRRLQNASRFHLCLSEAEGWGHYLVEAMSVGALTLTLDAAPMNELIGPDRGLLVPSLLRGRQNLADTVGFDAAALEQTIEQALRLPEEALERLGARARGWFLDNRSGFSGRVGQALAALDDFRKP